jgi:ABC-2 type transport system permease protein
MRRILAQARKELTQLVRDRLALGLALVLPVVLIGLLGTAISLTVTDIPIVIQDLDQTPLSRQYADVFRNSLTFRVVTLPSAMSPERMLNSGRVRRPSSSPLTSGATSGAGGGPDAGAGGRHGQQHRAPHPGQRQPAHARLRAAGQAAAARRHDRDRDPPRFNRPHAPQVLRPRVHGPGAVHLSHRAGRARDVAEGEQQTILQVYVSSISAHEFLLGKIPAGMAVGLVQCLLGVVLMLTVFSLDFVGDPTPFVAASVLYVFCMAAFASLVGSAIPNQAAAVQAVGLGGFLLSFLLSGLIFPVENIPDALRWISNLVQARYYVLSCATRFCRAAGGPRGGRCSPSAASVWCSAWLRSMRRMQVK